MITDSQVVPIESLFYADAGPHVITAQPTPTASPAARGTDLHSLLASGLAGLDQLGSEPFSVPAEVDDTLPIETMLYSGRGAIDRAIELRGEIRARGSAPTGDEIDELFALLDLAVTA